MVSWCSSEHAGKLTVVEDEPGDVVLSRLNVGIWDLDYKIRNGYHSYANASSRGVMDINFF